jgi:hypothetical protein
MAALKGDHQASNYLRYRHPTCRPGWLPASSAASAAPGLWNTILKQCARRHASSLEVLGLLGCSQLALHWLPESSRAASTPCRPAVAACSTSGHERPRRSERVRMPPNYKTGYQPGSVVCESERRPFINHASSKACLHCARLTCQDCQPATNWLPPPDCAGYNKSALEAHCSACLRAWQTWTQCALNAVVCWLNGCHQQQSAYASGPCRW